MMTEAHEHGATPVQTAHDHCATSEGSSTQPPRSGRIDWPLHRELRRRAGVWGVGAAAALLAVYLVVLGIANSLEHAVGEIRRLWYWMAPLLLGFALQVGLFAYARRATRGERTVHARGVAASGGASTLSMVACCAHHLTDVLPLIGLAGAALFLTEYQDLFLLLGVLSNVVGLTYVLGLLNQHGLYPRRPSLFSVVVQRWQRRALVPTAIACGVVFLGAVARAVL